MKLTGLEPTIFWTSHAEHTLESDALPLGHSSDNDLILGLYDLDGRKDGVWVFMEGGFA